VLSGLIGDGHLSAISVDNYVIEGVNCAHSAICFVKAKVVKMADLGWAMGTMKFPSGALFH
jgi:hypothetical protein